MGLEWNMKMQQIMIISLSFTKKGGGTFIFIKKIISREGWEWGINKS